VTPAQFLLLADALPEALFLLTADGVVLAANRAAEQLLGRNPSAIAGRPLAELVENPPERLVHYLRLWARSRMPVPAPLRWRGADDVCVHGCCHGFLLRPASPDRPAYLLLRGTSSTARLGEFLALNRERERQRNTLRKLQHSREALALAHEKALVTLHSIGDAVITTDKAGNVEYLNPISERLTGWSNAEAVGRPLGEVFNIIDEVTRDAVTDPVARCLAEDRVVALASHTALVARDGTEYLIEDSAAPIRDARKRVLGAVVVFRDVTGDRLARRQLEYLAQHDTLTGLYNRHYFERRLEHAVQLSKRGDLCHAMLYMDLDQFQIINDTAGHTVGDELLGEVAGLFARHIRQGDTFARLGGDEFGILLSNVGQEAALETAAAFVRAMKDFRFSREGFSYEISTSIGIAMVDAKTVSPAEVLRQADIACFVAKQQGRNCYHMYSEGEEGADLITVGEMSLVSQIREALAGNQFTLYFQPIVRIDDGSVALYEVLVRMIDKDGELMPPSIFIPVAERYGLMTAIDYWVVSGALRALKQRHARGERLRFTINLSGVSLGDAELLALIKREAGGLEPGCLVFEVTETAAVAHMEKAGTFMRELKEIGCRFALDDFGTGFSSFAYLKYLPVDYLKIDGTFVRDIVTDPVDQAMVRSINQIAHSLGKQTIAEFVESAAVLDRLAAFGVNYAQGYHVGGPAPLFAPA